MIRIENLRCSVCNKLASEDCNFHNKYMLCNRHYLQMRRHGKIIAVDALCGKSEKKCFICGDIDHKKYYVWRHEGEYKGRTLCGKHYNQMINHGEIIDATISDHKEKELWKDSEILLLEEMYKNYVPLDVIQNELGRNYTAISCKASKLGLTQKYMKDNNPRYKAIYQDYDWCFYNYIVLGRKMEDMANDCGVELRTIQKWCGDIHRLNNHTFQYEKELTDIQKQIIMFSSIGDGHITKGDKPVFIESHAENQKDYLYWKYEIIKDICISEPSRCEATDKEFYGKKYHAQPCYRITTRIVNQLQDIKNMSKSDIISRLNELGLSIHFLDDASRTKGRWCLCLAEYTDDEIILYQKILSERFLIQSSLTYTNGHPYINIKGDGNKIVDDVIMRNIPTDLDIIKYKIAS